MSVNFLTSRFSIKVNQADMGCIIANFVHNFRNAIYSHTLTLTNYL